MPAVYPQNLVASHPLFAQQMRQRRQIGQYRQDPNRGQAVREFIGRLAPRPVVAGPQPLFPTRHPNYQWRPSVSGIDYGKQINRLPDPVVTNGV